MTVLYVLVIIRRQWFSKVNVSMFERNSVFLDRNLALEAVRVTEAAALASYNWIGMGDEHSADQAAVDAMRDSLNNLAIDGTVVIGEGERDKAPRLYIGEKVGNGEGPVVDIALDPLEGTGICASGGMNSLSVLAMSEKGGFLHAPDIYMNKIASNVDENVINIHDSITNNLRNLAKFKKCHVSDLVVSVLHRERHEELIAEIRQEGARVFLIGDGDVASVIATSLSGSGIDMHVGSGGAPEGVLAAAALYCMGGFMQSYLMFDNADQVDRANSMGVIDTERTYNIKDMVGEDVMFSATGVTDGSLLAGVNPLGKGKFSTHSIVMRSKTGTVRHIRTEHVNRNEFINPSKA